MTFTAFCQEDTGEGTIWIESFDSAGLEEAKEEAIALCAEAWGWPVERIHLLGIAEGDVKILHWEDLCEKGEK